MKTPLKNNLQFKHTGVVRDLVPLGANLHSFLLYGGDVELKLAASNRNVYAHTNNYLVYEFWECLLENPKGVSNWVRNLSSLLDPDAVFSNQKMFAILQDTWSEQANPYTRAAFFYLLSRCSDTGLPSSGKFIKEGVSNVSLVNLERFQTKNFNICLDKVENYLEGTSEIPSEDYLLFPVGNYNLNLFEKGKSKGIETTSVNHRKLRAYLKAEKKNWIILYKYHPRLREMYKDYNILMIDEYGRQTNREMRCKEVAIANF